MRIHFAMPAGRTASLSVTCRAQSEEAQTASTTSAAAAVALCGALAAFALTTGDVAMAAVSISHETVPTRPLLMSSFH